MASLSAGPQMPRSAELEALFRAHHARVLRTAYRMLGSMADAEDVLQAVFLRLTRGLETYHLSDEPAGYIHRMTVNASLDLLRQRPRSRGGAAAEMLSEVPCPRPGPERQHDNAELQAALRDAVAQLGPRAAQIFTLRYLEGCDNTSIARQLGMSRVTVGVALHRARQQLRKSLGAYWGRDHREAEHV